MSVSLDSICLFGTVVTGSGLNVAAEGTTCNDDIVMSMSINVMAIEGDIGMMVSSPTSIVLVVSVTLSGVIVIIVNGSVAVLVDHAVSVGAVAAAFLGVVGCIAMTLAIANGDAAAEVDEISISVSLVFMFGVVTGGGFVIGITMNDDAIVTSTGDAS